MNLSVIIPTYNRKDILFESLKSLYNSISIIESNKLNISIVVIDDGSVDGTSSMLSNYYPEINVIYGDGNYWWTKSINCGVRYAINNLASEYCLFWNDDIFPDKYYFKNLVNILFSEKKEYIFGSKVYDSKTKKLWSTTMVFNKFTGSSSYLKDESKFNEKIHYKWLTGMGVIVSKKVIEDVNYLDEINFPQYFGDLDFTLRASKKNYQISSKEELKIFNQTEYSSFIGKDFKSFIKSLKKSNVGSRYNMYIKYKLLSRHTISFLWIFTFIIFYLKYFIDTFLIKKLK